MNVTRQSLAQYYARLSDEELRGMLASGELTPLAIDLAGEELRRRGIDIAPPASDETPPPVDAADAEGPLQGPPSGHDAPDGSTDGVGDGDLVLLGRFSSPIEAEIVRGRLEAEGILAVTADTQTMQMLSLMSPAIGGVRVLVRQSQLAQALQVLRSL